MGIAKSLINIELQFYSVATNQGVVGSIPASRTSFRKNGLDHCDLARFSLPVRF
jgi:hypothetical protein